MKVKDIMTKNVYCADPETTISEVAKVLFSNHFHGMPVVENSKLVGIITESDFFSQKDDFIFLPEYISFLKETRVAGKIPQEEKEKIKQLINSKAKDIMTNQCITADPKMEVSRLIEIIKKTKYNSIPVVDAQKNILGIVTIGDIVSLFESKELAAGRQHPVRQRNVDEIMKNVDSWWDKNLVAIKELKWRNWKGALVVAFALGLIIILALIISI